MIYVEISPTLPSHHRIAEGVLKRAALETLRHQSVSRTAALALVLADDEQLRALNREYLGVDALTDVLAFPANETDPETGAPYLGDVLISVPRAAAQAAEAGHDLEAEVQLLIVHGVLHLLGHDHASAEEKARMWAVQAEVLERLGLSELGKSV